MDPSFEKTKRLQKNKMGLQRKKGRESLGNCRFDSNQAVRLVNQKTNLLSAQIKMTWRQKGPFTRAQRRQSKPITRNMRRLDAARKLKFICGCCASSEKTAPRQRAPESGRRLRNQQSNKAHKDIKDYSTHKRKQVYEGKGFKGRVKRVWSEFGKVSAATARGRAPAAPTLSLTSFGEYIHLIPLAFANKRFVKQVAAYDGHRTGSQFKQESKKFVIKQGLLYPQVELCDIGPICVECKPKCSFVLPDDVKSKLIHCFTKEMRAGFRFEPGCMGHKKHSFNQSVQVHTNEQNDNVTNDPHSLASSHVHPEQESNGPASCSSEHGLKVNMNGMQNKCTDYNQNILGKDLHANMEFGKKADILSKTSQFKNSVDGQLDSLAQVCRLVYLEEESRDGQPVNLNGPTLDNAEDLDSFSCQRVRVYPGKTSVTCARTYLTWPFLSRKPSPEPAENGYSSAGHISPFQNKLSGNEPTDLQKGVSISKQRGGGNGKNTRDTLKNTENVVGVSSDIIRNINGLYPSCSSRQSAVMPPEKLNSFCKDLPAWLSRRPTSVQASSPNNDSASSTPSPSRLGLTETVKNMSASPLTDANSCLSSSRSPLTTSTPNVLRITLPQVVSLDNLDSNDSRESSFLLSQDMEASLDETINSQSPPKLEPYFKTCKNKSLLSTDTNILVPPLLSPIKSPLKHIVSARSVEFENQNSDEDDHKLLPEIPIPEMYDMNEKNHAYDCGWPQKKTFPANNDVPKFVEAPSKEHQLQPLVSDTSPPASAALTDSSSSPSSIESEKLQSSGEYSTDKGSHTSEKSVNEEPEDLEMPEVLDEIEAFEKDILLVDVFQDDPELFEKLPQKSLLKLGPVRTSYTSEMERKKMVKIMLPVSESSRSNHQSVTPVNFDFLHNSPENSPCRPWRPQSNTSALQSSTKTKLKIMDPAEARVVNAGEERNKHFPMENLCLNISPHLASRLGLPMRLTNTSAAVVRWQKPYCKNYFSESQNCVFKMCRFHHVPLEGDEKFCTETVALFAKNPACLHKAGAVFTGYYQKNKPGMFFSKPVFISLLRGLFQAGMLCDIFSVLRTILAYNIVPEYEFILNLFNFIREKSLMSFVPELLQLTYKMFGAGLPLGLDCVKNTPNLHHTVPSNSPKAISGHKLLTHTEYFNLAHAVVEMELCTKQDDWKRLGEVFQSICQSTQVIQVERICGRIAVALLSESKDRLTLPFAAFAETATHDSDEDNAVKSCLGRIGVSLMLRYHKTHQWAKGQKVVEVLSAAKVSYATMKGLFGNEDRTSRCHLVSVATELFLLNGSVEGALNTLRENEWFLTSSAWPCETTDLEKRTHVLLGLAEQTSHRDTLEVLSNLPGLKEPNGHIDISKYTPKFIAHLQVCLDRQILVLASDLVDFMLSKSLTVDHAMLQMLLHRLGKQNFWLKAREIFRNSVSKGYYPGVSAPPGLMTLMVPSQLGEIELALTFEMFITVNATAIFALPECTTSTMTITLKRTQSGESDYLSAGSRLLSAACILQPKLNVRYTAVNSSQEQVFILDISSARRWLRHNHLWANEVWTFST